MTDGVVEGDTPKTYVPFLHEKVVTMKSTRVTGSTAFVLLLMLSGLAEAQIVWEKYEGNPVIPNYLGGGYALAPVVLFDTSDGLYRMWFTAKIYGGPWSIYYATSLDRASWSLYANNPVLEGGSDPFESNGVLYAGVVHDGVEYKMLYTGADPVVGCGAIGLATSSDGINWTKYINNPVLTPTPGEWDSVYICTALVVHFDGSTYSLYYLGYDGTYWQTGLATSTDCISWVKHPSNPVLPHGNTGSWDERVVQASGLFTYQGTFYMFYAGTPFDLSRSYVGLASSGDGIMWTKYDGNPVLVGGVPGTWDWSVGPACPVLRDGIVHLWYSGDDQDSYPVWSTGYATSPLTLAFDVAQLGVCYGSTGSAEPTNPGALITIDPLTGDGTLIGPTGIVGEDGPAVRALAIKSTGEMYAMSNTSSSDLYSVNASSGAATFVANTGLLRPGDICFDANDVLYAVDETNILYTIDEVTGTRTVVGATGVMLGGLAYDPTDGTMYGSGTNDDIYTIDLSTGAATLVGTTGLGGNIPDIHFDQAGNLYGTKRGTGDVYDFIAIDKSTGAGTVIGSTGFAAVVGLATRLTPPTPPSRVSLLFPPNNAMITSDSVMLFLWNQSSPYVDFYWFELATDSLFSQPEIDSTITDTLTFVYDLTNNQTYWWRVRAHNELGWGQFSETRNFQIVVTNVEEQPSIPLMFSLSQNYPNPFNPSTTIRYALSEDTRATLKVYNMLGQLIATLVDEFQSAGYREANWNGTNGSGASVASGIYVYRLTTSKFVYTKRMLFLR